jgi:hypothetical protein
MIQIATQGIMFISCKQIFSMQELLKKKIVNFCLCVIIQVKIYMNCTYELAFS